MGAYYVPGPVFFGQVLLLNCSIIIVSFVLVHEKTGYARDFETERLRLTKGLVALFFAFVLFQGPYYLPVTFFPKGLTDTDPSEI